MNVCRFVRHLLATKKRVTAPIFKPTDNQKPDTFFGLKHCFEKSKYWAFCRRVRVTNIESESQVRVRRVESESELFLIMARVRVTSHA